MRVNVANTCNDNIVDLMSGSESVNMGNNIAITNSCTNIENNSMLEDAYRSCKSDTGVSSESQNVNDVNSNSDEEYVKLYDVKNQRGDKYLNAFLTSHDTKRCMAAYVSNCEKYKLWKMQTGKNFGFIPLGDFILPDHEKLGPKFESPVAQYNRVKVTGPPNFLSARTPVRSQLNVDAWQKHLVNYWDDQLIHLIKYGFPLDFNRDCHLKREKQNHASATKYPDDNTAYLQEEMEHGAILGPFLDSPIVEAHYSPFMSRDKPG